MAVQWFEIVKYSFSLAGVTNQWPVVEIRGVNEEITDWIIVVVKIEGKSIPLHRRQQRGEDCPHLIKFTTRQRSGIQFVLPVTEQKQVDLWIISSPPNHQVN